VTELEFRMKAFLPGSTTQGADATDADIITSQFAITIFDGDQVDSCNDSTLYPDQTTTIDSQPRGYEVVYQVPTAGEADNRMPIPALRVTSSKGSACELVTYAEYARENCNEWGCWTEWKEIKSESNGLVETAYETDRAFYLTISQ
jgi:hypothetical protein